MNNVAHLQNVSKFFEKFQNPEVAKLQMHYTQCCRDLGDEVELPKQDFGPAVLCPKCGTAWATTKHKTRILPRRFTPRRIENLIGAYRLAGARLTKYRRSLILKCERNRANKIVKICSVCSGRAKFDLSMPQRSKRPKTNPPNSSGLQLSCDKKKKRRSRDKTAGLNLSMADTPERTRDTDSPSDKNQTPIFLRRKKDNPSRQNTPVLAFKPQKINLSKLKGIINTSVTPSKKTKLHAFLQEL